MRRRPSTLDNTKMAVVSSGSKVDSLYRAAIQAPKFFSKGWGDFKLLERLFQLHSAVITGNDRTHQSIYSRRPLDHYQICQNSSVKILNASNSNGSADVLECEFLSPLANILPGALPKESERARFQLILPKDWSASTKPVIETKSRPICVQLAGTGDHYYWRRRHFMAMPLVKEHGVASIILENPFYGCRKPKSQTKSGLRYVSDLFVMGAALFFEIIALLSWCERQGYGPLGVTGISMGGHMASIAATGWNKPLGIIPCLSWSTAAPVFTTGVMKASVSWKVLEDQLQAKPEYISLLEKYCKEFSEKRKKPIENSDLQDIIAHNEEKKLFERPDREQQGTNLKETKRFKKFDIDKKKLGLFAVDFDSILKLDNLPSGLFSSFSDKLNFDGLRQYSFPESNYFKHVRQDTVDFMDSILSEFTHLKNFATPVPGSQIIYIFANYDKYVPRMGVESPAELWPMAEVRYIDCGHIVGVLKYQKVFRDAIYDALCKL